MQRIYEEYVDAAAPPARTTVEVSGMNNGYLIEVDAIAPAGKAGRMSNVPNIVLNDGHSIPQLGFGVFQIEPRDTARATREALEIGYRHIDTAEMYRNERGVGEAIRAAGLDRADVYVTSKLSNAGHRPDDARGIRDDALGARVRVRRPVPDPLADAEAQKAPSSTTWQVLVEFQREGRIRSIGVSNFEIDHLERLAARATSFPR